jgi:hypothetical protein
MAQRSRSTTAELNSLRDAREAARLTLEIRQLQLAAGAPLSEAWGDVVDRREFLTDDPSFGITSSLAAPFTTIDDRASGRLRPVYETEADLARIRAGARNLGLLTGLASGALDALANYTLSSGFAVKAQISRAADTVDQPALAEAVQACLDEFLDENDFTGGLDRELHHKSREDGEAFLVLTSQPADRVRCRFIEPDQVTQPAAPRPIEEWLGIGEEFPSCWTFGVHARAGEADSPLGYHVVYDASGRDWDYLPAARVEHIKRNVPRSAKRGVSDFHAICGDIEREARLRRNMAEGAALQAAIAWILQAPSGSTQAQIQGLGSGDLFAQYQKPVHSGTKTQNVQRYPPGTVLKPSPGLEYKPGPLGADRNSGFELVGQYVLRSIGVRWNMPEYLISGDASNANYASALVAESPFVKAREADQQFYRRHVDSLLWKVLRLAWQAGRFASVPWAVLVRSIDLKLDLPKVATRDPLKAAQTAEIELRMGTVSRRTVASEAGRDFDAERAAGGDVAI